MKQTIKIVIFAIGVVLLVHGLGFAQTASTKKVEHPVKATEPPTIKLKPMQLQTLMNLDSARTAFNKDVEANKDAINTFNTLMQRSTDLGKQQKQAYNLILESWGYDPKKYVIKEDLKNGEIQLKESK